MLFKQSGHDTPGGVPACYVARVTVLVSQQAGIHLNLHPSAGKEACERTIFSFIYCIRGHVNLFPTNHLLVRILHLSRTGFIQSVNLFR